MCGRASSANRASIARLLTGGKASQDLPSDQAGAGLPPKREARVTRIELEGDRSWVCAGQQCDRVTSRRQPPANDPAPLRES